MSPAPTQPDFDELIERRGTVCNKWDDMAGVFGLDAPDALPMWVADMDFAAPAGVPVLALPYGYNHGETIEACAPDRLVASLAALL